MWFSNAQNCCRGVQQERDAYASPQNRSGSSSAKSVYLCAITNTFCKRHTPSIARNYGAIGTIGRDKQVTFSIPVDAVQGLADGYYGGLCLYETPYNSRFVHLLQCVHAHERNGPPITNPISNAYSAAARLSAKKEDSQVNIAISLGGQIRMVICSSFVIAKRKDTHPLRSERRELPADGRDCRSGLCL